MIVMPRIIVLANTARNLAAPVSRRQQEAGRQLIATPTTAARNLFTHERKDHERKDID